MSLSGAGTEVVIGIDVGTGSARAGLFDLRGELKATEKREIVLFHEGSSIVEQSSENIWRAVSECVRGAVDWAKTTDRTTVITIVSDAFIWTPGDALWDVGVPQVSKRSEVNAAAKY